MTDKPAKPFIKWAGGKAYLLPKITQIIDASGLECQHYHYTEPMVGGGAIYYSLGPRFQASTITDLNPELINLYRVVQTDVEGLIAELTNGHYLYTHKSDPITLERYRLIRASDPTTEVARAARTIYLLKTCFNGLMRVNKSGRFNTPPGSYTNPTICDVDVLRTASSLLDHTTIARPADAIEFLDRKLPDKSFLFLDPPYHHPDDGKFTGYSGEFKAQQQSDLVRAMLDTGYPFIYTNRATDFIMSLFAGASTSFERIPLKHSIQPKYTTGVVEEELIAYRF